MKYNHAMLFVHFSLFIFFTSCNSYNLKSTTKPQERFEIAKKMFDNKDYYEAKNQFKIITLNNSGASFVDDAQFYLAECHFKMKEYVFAADEYSRLSRLYPKSEWLDDAVYKVAICDFNMSPKPALDQAYTLKAIESLQLFLEEYSNSVLVEEAEKMLGVCRAKLSEKEFKAGELYRKLGDNYGALVYFRSVVDNYYDTEFLEPAVYWKAESLFRLERYAESRLTFEELLRKFPKTDFLGKAKSRLKEIENGAGQTKESNDVSEQAIDG